MAAWEHIQFGQFGDFRDNYDDTRMYQPPGSKERFHLRESYGSVSAHRIGKPDTILPGGRPAKQLAGHLDVWSGGTGSDRPEILQVGVRGGFRGKGLADAMLHMAVKAKPDLSHAGSLSAEGARFAQRNPLPNDTEYTKKRQLQSLTADAATAMVGGPKRRGYG